MEKLISALGIDPNKINIDSNVNVSQDHINQLFAGVDPLLEKYHKDNPLLCDAECQDNQDYNAAYSNYLTARENLISAPDEFARAERVFYTIYHQGETGVQCTNCNPDVISANLGEQYAGDPDQICESRNSAEQCAEAGGIWGGQSYLNYKESQAKTQVQGIIDILSDNFDQKAVDLGDRIQNLKAQTISNTHLTELEDSYGRDINQIDTEISRVQDDSNINDRLAVYYSRQIIHNRRYLFYIRIIYWMSLTTYFLYFIIFKELFTQKKLMTTVILLFVLPFLWKPIITWFFPVKVYMPPPEPVCPSKPSVKVPPPPVQPAPSKKSSWKPPPPPPPQCPAPTLWSMFKNSLPAIGQPNARQNLKNKMGNLENDISFGMSRMTNKIKKII